MNASKPRFFPPMAVRMTIINGDVMLSAAKHLVLSAMIF